LIELIDRMISGLVAGLSI